MMDHLRMSTGDSGMEEVLSARLRIIVSDKNIKLAVTFAQLFDKIIPPL